MPRFSMKKFIPTPESIKNSRSLRFLGAYLHDPNLFHLNRRSVTVAFFWGILIGLLPPIPVHTPLAAIAALIARCNLPLILALVWISNPITIPIIAYEFYHLGLFILQAEALTTFEFSWNSLRLMWKPYLVGTAIGSMTFAIAGYFISNYMWRLNTKRKWYARQKKRYEARDGVKTKTPYS